MTAFRPLFVLALGVSVVAAAGQEPIPKGPNILVGRVAEIVSDAPVGGAVVTLTVADQNVTFRQRPAVRNVMTTPEGGFVFRDLPAGQYAVTVTAFGYVRSDYLPEIVDIDNAGKPTVVSLHLWKTASISGHVFDERGEPVVGVPVHALKRVMIGGALVLRNEFEPADTDDRGVYQIADLPPGNYVAAVLATSVSVSAGLADRISAAPNFLARSPLTSALLPGDARQAGGDGLRLDEFLLQQLGPSPVLSPDGRVLMYSNTMYPGTSDPSAATIVPLASGESRTGVDIPISFVPAVRVSGVLAGPSGPVPDVTIRLVSSSSADVDSLEPAGLASAVTDMNGRFVFLGVPAGRYTLRAIHVRQASQTSPGFSLSIAQPLAVGDKNVTDLELTLSPGPTVSGRVEFEPAAGAPDAARNQVDVVLRPVAATSWSAVPGRVQPDGTFSATSLARGRQEIYAASAEGWRVVGVTRGGRSVGDYVIDVGDGDISGLVVTVSNGSRRVSGTVTDARGAVDSDAMVVVFPADTTVWREGIFQSRRVRRVRTSSKGVFDMTFLAPGEYYLAAVSVRHAFEWDDPLFLERLIPGATRIALAEGDNKTVALTTVPVKPR